MPQFFTALKNQLLLIAYVINSVSQELNGLREKLQALAGFILGVCHFEALKKHTFSVFFHF